MAFPDAREFAARLGQRAGLTTDVDVPGSPTSPLEGGLRRLWEASDLSASEFADEVASFFGLARASLQEMMAAQALVRGQVFARQWRLTLARIRPDIVV